MVLQLYALYSVYNVSFECGKYYRTLEQLPLPQLVLASGTDYYYSTTQGDHDGMPMSHNSPVLPPGSTSACCIVYLGSLVTSSCVITHFDSSICLSPTGLLARLTSASPAS